MRPLGKEQLKTLLFMASPGSLLVTPVDKVVKSLERRGLVGPCERDKHGCGTRITPNGMRVLADAFEAGALDQFMSFAKRKKSKAP